MPLGITPGGTLTVKGVSMSPAKKAGVGIGVILSIIALLFGFLGTWTGGVLGFGIMKQTVSQTAEVARTADVRSQSNKAELTGVGAKVDIVLEELRDVSKRIDNLK